METALHAAELRAADAAGGLDAAKQELAGARAADERMAELIAEGDKAPLGRG